MSLEKATQDLNLQVLITADKNPRGIPSAKFIVRSEIHLSLSGT
jgi:hypothetical protein